MNFVGSSRKTCLIMRFDFQRLLNPEHHNFYFADFYCNYHTHYVTIVVCVKDSDTDRWVYLCILGTMFRFCSTHCLKMDIFNNPFLEVNSFKLMSTSFFQIRREFDYAQYAPRTMYYINKKVWVEIYYTENIHLNWGRFSPIVATGRFSFYLLIFLFRSWNIKAWWLAK